MEAILEAYRAPERAYHNLEHLDEVLQWWNRIGPGGRTLGLALFYHDVVYDPRRHDNEEASALWARRDLQGRLEEVGEIEGLILDTRHQAQPSTELGTWMVDFDLAILGADPQRFDRYDAAVRQEYGWVPAPLYLSGRRQILQQFLERPRIYHHLVQLEDRARRNLERALARQE